MTHRDLQVVASFDMPEWRSAVSQLKWSEDPADYFARLKAGFLAWAASLPAGEEHRISVFTRLRAAAEVQRRFADEICVRWNADDDLRSRPLGVEISIGTDELVAFECTTFEDVIQKTGRREMHVLETAEVLATIDRQAKAWEHEERERRRANPVTTPVPLPLTVRWQIAHYLRLEHGERFWERDSVKPWHLRYVGEFVIDSVPTRYWRYPTSEGEPRYATVERFDDHYNLGMTQDPPPKS